MLTPKAGFNTMGTNCLLVDLFRYPVNILIVYMYLKFYSQTVLSFKNNENGK